MLAHKLTALLWWSNLRRIFEPIARLLVKKSTKIKTGVLHGCYFKGGLAQMLGIYEYPIQNIIIQHLGNSGVFYDVGANNGFFTLLAAKLLGESGSVHSFEPFPKNIESLKNVIQKNKLTNCCIEEVAIADFSGETHLYFTDNIATPSIREMEGKTKLIVRPFTLDEYVLSHPKPTLIKLDVEGAEIAALMGSKKIITSKEPPTWIIEIHRIEEKDEILSLLSPGKYIIEQIAKPGKSPNIFPILIIAYHHEK